MTATFLFRLKTLERPEKIKANLIAATSGQFEVGVLEENGGLNCFFDYALKDPAEQSAIRKAVTYLQSVAIEKVLYIQCYDALNEETKLNDMEIEIEDIFKRLYPSLSAEGNYLFAMKEIKSK